MEFQLLLTLALLCARLGLGSSTFDLQGLGCRPEGGVDSSRSSQEQLAAHELQQEISCDGNTTAKNQLLEDVKAEFGVTGNNFYSHVPTLFDHDETCRSAMRCPGGEVTWCITVYHPTEQVQICMDRNGIINQTNYAQLLQLQCYFSVPRAAECTGIAQQCLHISQPEHMLDRSVMTCSTIDKQANCSSTTATLLFVEVTGHEMERPRPEFQNRTELSLGETNLFLCVVYFTESRFYNLVSARWHIDGSPIEKIHEDPYCFSRNDCIPDALAETRGHRVRAYEEQRGEANCPTPILFYKEWLWIEDATLEDANHTYTCSGYSTFFNPFPRTVEGSMEVTFTPVFPLVEPNIFEVPSSPNNSSSSTDPPLSLTLQPGESFQWTCAVSAGVEDQLVWLRDGEPIPPSSKTTGSESLDCPADGPGSLHPVYQPAEVLGEYERGYNTTLTGCNLGPSLAGLYQCQLNRTRAAPLVVWSATVVMPLPPQVTTEPGGGSVEAIPIGIGVGAGVLVLLIVVVAALVCVPGCCRRRKSRTQAITMLHPVIAPTEIIGMVEIPGRNFEKNFDKVEDSGKKLQAPVSNDPLEFPRYKLEMTGVVLGEGSFGQVLQARAEGIVKGFPDRNIVAVKTCRDKAPHHEFNELYEELKLMKQMRPHRNVVNLLGHCTTSFGPLYLIIEFAIHGSLRDYLHQCKDALCKLNHTPHIVSSRKSRRPSLSLASTLQEKVPLSQQSSVFSDISVTSRCTPTSSNPRSSLGLEAGLKSRRPTLDSGFCGDSMRGEACADLAQDYVNCKGLLYMEDVANFALQIASGLQHLADLEIAHCDLAARNVLIAEGFVLKIGDFGMARDISEKQYYRKHTDGRIPVKWSAPEVLENQIFTHQSDIWSYGVVLWEILTYGQKPYPDQSISYSWNSFINYLKNGNRLPQPEGCPPQVYDLMLSCWQLSPHDRPTANELTELLSRQDDDDTISLASNGSALPASEQPKTRPQISQEDPDIFYTENQV